MADFPKAECDRSLSGCRRMGRIGLGEGNKRDMSSLDEEALLKKSEKPDSYVLDVGNLSCVDDTDANSNAKGPRSLSRKGCQGCGERKPSEREPTDAQSTGFCTVERTIDLPLEWTSLTSTTEENRNRRYSRCSSSNLTKRTSWISPQRVLLIFSTLSCLGTLILIYFALSISINNEDSPQIQ